MDDEETNQLIDATLGFYGETLDWLEGHHADFASKSELDLRSSQREAAVWKLSGNSLALSRALLLLLIDGQTGQTWPTMRAIHEGNRLLTAVGDAAEETLLERWQADKEIPQRKARAAEARTAERVPEAMKAAGLDGLSVDVGEQTGVIYKGMSKAAHHQRSVVDEQIDFDSREMIYRSDPRPDRRLGFVIYAGTLLQEVLLVVGDALCVLWGPPFYQEHLTPMLRQFERVLEGLQVIEAAHGIETA